MHYTMTLAEALSKLGLMGRALPRFITSVSGSGDVLEVVADARAIRNLPGALKLATRLVPAVRARLRVESFVDGVAMLSVDANAGGLPAHKLLGLASSRIDAVIAHKRLPYGSVRVQGGQVALDVHRLLADRHPGHIVHGMAFRDGAVVLVVEPASAPMQG